jgi:hypothetical protein
MVATSPMRSFLLVGSLSLAITIAFAADVQAVLGGRGPPKPKDPEPVVEKEEPDPRLDEQWKWMLAAFVVLLVVYTTWRLLSESAKVRPPDKRQPWEIE